MIVEFINNEEWPGVPKAWFDQPAVPRVGDEIDLDMRSYVVTRVFWIYDPKWDREDARVCVWVSKKPGKKKRIFRTFKGL